MQVNDWDDWVEQKIELDPPMQAMSRACQRRHAIEQATRLAESEGLVPVTRPAVIYRDDRFLVVGARYRKEPRWRH